ncbi:MAG: DUF2461 domain-containing protein [Cyclobacteriaceae bacterium]|nr:DUF2461 domain-containing protein [Cyclobacteriaceae bacterium]
MTQIAPGTLQFLKKLSKNNDRDWFQGHKEEYLLALANAEGFFDSLIRVMNTHDDIETPSGKKALYRIYNDVRFSDDKTPYNPRFAGHLKRRKPQLRGGYYLWIKPGDSKLGCGFAYPDPADLKRIRVDILHNYKEWRRLLNAKPVRSYFGSMEGDQVKTAPQGFPKDHPAIDLLRYKQFWFEHPFSDKEVTSAGFLKEVNKVFRSIRPLFDYMSEVLTTDENGESVLHGRSKIPR